MNNYDSFSEIGSQHKICEDFIISGQYPVPHVILSDGCSSSKDTNCGAMILTQLAKQYLQFKIMELNNINYEDMGKWIICNAETTARQLGLSPPCLDATLIISFMLPKLIHVYIYGDGYIIRVNKHKEIESTQICFSDNAPYYLSYNLDFIRKKAYSDMKHMMSIQNYKKTGGFSTIGELPHNHPLHYSFIPSFYKEIYIASDGIDSFIRNGVKLPTENVIKSFLNIEKENRDKTTKGVFIQRRCRNAIKIIRKEGWDHYDDISFGGFQLCHDTT